MAATTNILQIFHDEVRFLSGQWPALSSCVAKPIAGKQQLVQGIKEVVSSIQIKDASCYLVLSRQDVVLKVLDVPSTDPKEIRRMLSLQIPTIVPFDETQVMYQYHVLRVKESGHSSILVMIVVKNTLRTYLRAVESAGLSVKDVFISFSGQANYYKKFLQSGMYDNSCLVIAHQGSAEMLMCDKGKPVFSFYLAFGKKDVQANLQEMADAIALKIKDFSHQYSDAIPEKIYVSSDFDNADQAASIIAEKTKLVVDKIDLFAFVPESAVRFIEKNHCDERWVSLFGCCDAQDKNIFKSFLPHEIHSSKEKKKKRASLSRFLIVFLLTVMLLYGLAWTIIRQQQQRLDLINNQIASLAPRLEGLRSEQRFLDVVNRRSQQGDMVADMIKTVYEIFPEDVSVQNFSMRPYGVFEVQGFALKDQDVSKIQSALVESLRFDQVDLKYATKRRRFKMEYTEFKITFELAE